MISPQRFHITPDGPKKCSVTTGTCRYMEHSEDKSAAQQKYELMMGTLFPNDTLTRSATSHLDMFNAPENGSYDVPTDDDISQWLSNVKRLGVTSTESPHYLGHAVLGSFMRNLDTPDSDRDITLYVGGVSMNSPHKGQLDNGDDFSVIPVELISDKSYGYFEELHYVQHGKGAQFIKDSPYTPLLMNIRPSMYHAAESSRGSAKANFKTACSQDDPERVIKYVKRALVDVYRNRRICGSWDDNNFNPTFSNDERNNFYAQLSSYRHELNTYGRDSMFTKFSKDNNDVF